MPKATQKFLFKLTALAALAIILFNFPMMNAYNGYIGNIPVLYIALFGFWFLIVFLVRAISEYNVNIKSIKYSKGSK